MQKLICRCSNILSFENSQCLQCHSEVGYDPASGRMDYVGPAFRRCDNGVAYGACNWLVPAASTDTLCLACQLNETIPDLMVPGNDVLWAKMEAAKKRAIYSLLQFGLPVKRKSADCPNGLAFRFLVSVDEAPVVTGHEHGVITLNLEEANDGVREQNRTRLHEPYRTLLGHFRHEIGHYYWDQWFEIDSKRDEVLPALRAIFGDERVDYSQAMERHYQMGAPPDWQNSFITAYATMHPWEDWAETWAHYLHLTDAVETAHAFCVAADTATKPEHTYGADACALPPPFDKVDPTLFLDVLNEWVRISVPLNEVASSLGQGMLYPFVLSPPAIRKLHFVHSMMCRPLLG
jgi:hypothetical protein